MAKQKITIQWHNGGDLDYQASLDALEAYSPAPDVSATIRIKGAIDQSGIRALMGLADAQDLTVNVTLTAEWDENVSQLRLFPPDGSDWAEGMAEGDMDRLRDSLGT